MAEGGGGYEGCMSALLPTREGVWGGGIMMAMNATWPSRVTCLVVTLPTISQLARMTPTWLQNAARVGTTCAACGGRAEASPPIPNTHIHAHLARRTPLLSGFYLQTFSQYKCTLSLSHMHSLTHNLILSHSLTPSHSFITPGQPHGG